MSVLSRNTKIVNKDGYSTRELNDELDKIGGGGSRSATVVVAANNSSAKSKAGADFVVPAGSTADVTIQQAVNSLPAGGGEVKLLEGNFAVRRGQVVTIALPSNTTLRGVGAGTIISVYAEDDSGFMIKNKDANNANIHVSDLHIEWVALPYVSDGQYAIQFNNVYGGSITRVSVKNAPYEAFVLRGCQNIHVHQCTYTQSINTEEGYFISVNNTCSEVVVTDNISTRSYGGFLIGGNNHIIAGNVIMNVTDNEGMYVSGDNCLVANNYIREINSSSGIEVSGANNNLSGNAIHDTDGEAIYLYASANKNNIQNNYLKSAQGNGMYIQGYYNLVTNNFMLEMSFTDEGTFTRTEAGNYE